MAKRVLILDDEELLARMLGRVAHAAGFETSVAVTPKEFAASYESAVPDVVILDLALGESDGIEQIHYLTKRGYQHELVLVSGVDTKVLNAAASIARSQGLTVAGALRKPIRMADLTALLRRIDSDPETFTTERILTAVRSNELTLQLQPVVSATDGSVLWAEALVSWDHPTLGLLAPERFLPVAEKSRAVIEMLTEWSVVESLATYAKLRETGCTVPIATNVSARNLADPVFADLIIDHLAEAHVPPDALRLQFSEAGLAAAPREPIDTLARLRLKGLALSLDHYGTGETTIRQLLCVPFSELKLDPTIVARCFDSKEALAVLKAATGIAAAMEFTTTAVGVESERQREALRELGVDNVQGPLVAQPMALEDFRAWLAPATTLRRA
jgi:EAL domain-containing protein (putative c-di-GMP-specific phosphodiesterase class I)/AmiR/NasT family two-component response regulator